MHRRSFLTGLTQVALWTACIGVSESRAADALHDVLYYRWTPDVHEALETLDTVKNSADLNFSVPVEIVRQGVSYGVVLRVGGNQEAATALAAKHSAVLQSLVGSDEPLATRVQRQEYNRVFNVSYGLGPNLRPLIESFAVVRSVLGDGVARRLVIERTDHDNYALVYKRYGDLDKTRDAAKKHGELLKSKGISTSFIQEQSFRVIYDGTTAEAGEAPAIEVPAEPPPEQVDSPPKDPPPAEVPDSTPTVGLVAALVSGSSPLRDTINLYIQGLRRSGKMAEDERTAWLVYDLEADKTLVAINTDLPLQCASMVKPFVMLAFLHEVKAGRFIYGDVSKGRLEAMIQRSSNTSTNWVINKVGGPEAVQRVLDKHYSQVCRQTSIVETIASNGRTYRNKASAADYGRFLRALWRNELPHSKEMHRLMNLPGRDRLYNGAPSIPVGTAVYNKTGSTARLCGDMGILVAKKRTGGRVPYIVVGIIEKSKRASRYSSWIASRSNAIRAVSDRAYTYLKGEYALR